MKSQYFFVLSILCSLLAVSFADTWIDFPWVGELKRSSVANFGFTADIVGRRITGVQLRYSYGGLVCSNGQTTYWGCRNGANAHILFPRVEYRIDQYFAPSDADARINNTSGAGYLIEGVSVTDPSLFMVTDWLATTDDLRVVLPGHASRSVTRGTVYFFFSIRVDSFYTLASSVTLNSVAQTSAGDFRIAANYTGLQATRFRFVHVNGTVACHNQEEWNVNWGCNSNLFNGSTFCYEVFNTNDPSRFNFSNIIVPSDADPRMTSRSTDPYGFYFKMSNQATDHSGLYAPSMELETNVILSNTTYSLQFCEMAGFGSSQDNSGSATIAVQASFERWTLLGNVTIPVGQFSARVPIDSGMVGSTLAYVRILHKSGKFACGHKWGCVDNSINPKINETFYLSFGNATDVLFPLATTRAIIMGDDNSYNYLGYTIDDDSLTFELNTTITNNMSISILSSAKYNEPLEYAVYFTILPYYKFPECDPKSGFNEYTGGYSYVWCGICRWGYQGVGINGSCTDINECKDAGLCGNNANCVNLPGTYNCSCKANFVGDPYVGCVSCGNGRCESNLGEHCGNCARDCTVSPCGVCGDGTCEAKANEDCKTCFTDCGACVDPTIKCPGTPECTGRGSCRAGLCSCNTNYSGPACDQIVQPINIIKNDSTPDITFTPATSADILFQFAVYELREVDVNQNTVASIKLDDASFTVTTSDVTNATAPTYNLTSTLKNKARISILIWIFTENTEMKFLNETLSFTANSIKFDVVIQSWPFVTYANKMWLMTSQNAPAAGAVKGCDGDNTGIDGSGNLRFSQIQIGTTVLYGRFLEYAAIDRKKKNLEVKSISQTANNVVVAIVIPSFFESAVIDPDLSVLIATDDGKTECDEKRNKKNNIPRTAIIAVSVTVVGVAIIGAVIFLLFKKNIRKRLRRQTKSALDGGL